MKECMEFVDDKQESELKARGTCHPYWSIVVKSHRYTDEDSNTNSDFTHFNKFLNTKSSLYIK